MVPKKQTGKKATFLLSDEARQLLATLAEKHGVNMTNYLELLLRKDGKALGVELTNRNHARRSA